MLGRESNQGFSDLSDCRCLSAKLMNDPSERKLTHESADMGQLSCHRYACAAALHSLLRVSEKPQGHR